MVLPAGRAGLLTVVLAGACSAEPHEPCSLLAGACASDVVRSFRVDPIATASADLDRDGTVDMVSATRDSGLVIGWGDSTVVTQLSSDRRPVDVELVDLDGDGALEIVALHQTPGEIEAFRGAGPRTWTSAGTWAIEGLPQRLALADLDADGSTDAVVARSRPGGLVTLTRGFTVTTEVDLGADALEMLDVALGDLDGDRALDLAAVDVTAGSLHVLTNDGAGGFGAPRKLVTGPAPEVVKIVDFDADGDLDVVTTGRAQASVTVHHGDGAGALSPGTPVTTEASGLGFALVPVDGAQPWLVTAEPSRLVATEMAGDVPSGRRVRLASRGAIERVEQHGDAVVYAGDGFVARLDITAEVTVRERWRDLDVSHMSLLTRLVSGDLDGDALADLVLMHEDKLRPFLARADGSFAPAPALAVAGDVESGVAADVTGDGLLDLVLGLVGPTSVQVVIGGPGGALGPATPWIPAGPAKVLGSVDTDGDGRSAVVLAGMGVSGYFQGCEVVHFAADGSVATIDAPAITDFVRAVEAVDLDGDGGEDLVILADNLPEIALVTTHSQGLTGWDAPVARSRTTVAGAPVTTTPLAFAVGDIDGDGSIDALLGARGGVDVFLDVAGSIDEPIFSPLDLDSNAALVSVVDIDADGRADLLYAGLTLVAGAHGSGDGRFTPMFVQRQTTQAATRMPVAGGPPMLATADEFGLAASEVAVGPATRDPYTYRSLGGLTHVATGDIDGDGRPDVVVRGGGEDEGGDGRFGLGVFFNGPEGRFDRGVTAGFDAVQFAVADMDGQGGQEIVAADGSGRVYVFYLEDGRLVPRSDALLPSSTDPQAWLAGMVAGDRDGDGLGDVLALAVTPDGDGVELALAELRGAPDRRLTGDGATVWTGEAATVVAKNAVFPVLVTGDFDADDRLDVAILPGAAASVMLAWGDGDVVKLDVAADILSIGAGDLDDDGTPELLLGDASQVMLVPWIGRATGTHEVLDIAGMPGRLITVDLDEAAPIDIIHVGQRWTNVDLRDAAGVTRSMVEGRSGSIFADLDLDGRADLVSLGEDRVSITPVRGKVVP